MTDYYTLEAAYYEWVKNPTPDRIELDGQTVLDAGIDNLTWLWNTADSDKWLMYDGHLVDIEQ